MADDARLLDETPVRGAELDRGLYANFEIHRADAETQARHAGCRVAGPRALVDVAQPGWGVGE